MKKNTLRVLSLGAGVQSSALLLMMERGEIERVDAAIFSDTQAEPSYVYEWLDYLKSQTTIPIYTSTHGDLGKDAVTVRTSKRGLQYQKTTIPVYVRNQKGGVGMLKRWCTEKYKIHPVQRQIRSLLKNKGWTIKNTAVLLYIGISLDEAHRKTTSTRKWITNTYPLLEKELDRQACLDWMHTHKYKLPLKSSCVFCPFHSDEQWIDLKKDVPTWERIVEFEKQLQETYKQTVKRIPYLHDSCVPINEVAFQETHDASQEFSAECKGMCGT